MTTTDIGSRVEAIDTPATTLPEVPVEAPVEVRIELPRTPTQTTPSSSHKAAWVAVNALLAAIVVAVGVAVGGSAIGWWRVETVLSGSMRPGIAPGDVEILQSEPTSALRVGQIVAFHPPHEQITVTHRVVAVTARDGEKFIVTKGDDNDATDPWGPIRIEGSQVWVVMSVVPKVGYVTVWARTPLVRLSLALGIVFLVCAMLTVRIWRHP